MAVLLIVNGTLTLLLMLAPNCMVRQHFWKKIRDVFSMFLARRADPTHDVWSAQKRMHAQLEPVGGNQAQIILVLVL